MKIPCSVVAGTGAEVLTHPTRVGGGGGKQCSSFRLGIHPVGCYHFSEENRGGGGGNREERGRRVETGQCRADSSMGDA